MNEQSSSLETFKKQMKETKKDNDGTEDNSRSVWEPSENPPAAQNQAAQDSQTIKVTKNIILSFPSDPTGCGHIRNIFPMMFLNSVFAKAGKIIPLVSPVFVFQQDILARTKAIYFQRQMTPQHLSIITQYKNAQPSMKYKMIWEIDDFIWGHNEKQGGNIEDGVPSYNFGWNNISDEINH